MKTLSIIRHAKTERPEEYAHDRERPLTRRGQKDAARLAKALAVLTPPVDWIVSSPAVRARETAIQIVDGLSFKTDVFWEEEVYSAGVDQLLAVVAKAPLECEHVVLIGHNPGMCELLSGLCAGSPTRLNSHLAPGAIAHIALEVFRWDQVRWGCGQLKVLVSPKVLRKA